MYILFQDNAHDLKTEVIYVIFLELGRRFLEVWGRHLQTSSSKWLLNVHIQKAQDILSEIKEGILWIMYCILVAVLKKAVIASIS